MTRLSTVSSFFSSQIGVREFLPDININWNILTEESVVSILQSIIVKNVKKLCLSRWTLTKKKVSEPTTTTYVDLISKCTTLVYLDLEGCFYLSPSQVSQLLGSLSNLTRLLVSARWNRELHLWRKVYESYAKKILCPCFLNCTCTFMSLTHSLKRQCTENKQTRNRKYTKQFKWQDQCRNKKMGSNKTYMYMYM